MVEADVLVFAGDVHTKLNGIKWLKQRVRNDVPVLYVMGNHEFYGSKHPRLIEKIKEEAKGTSIHVMENEMISIDGYHFFGCTLWTDLELLGTNPAISGLEAMRMNDYKRIRSSETYRKLTPKDTRSEHIRSVGEIRKFLESHDATRSVVLTHHAPSILSLPEHRRSEPISCAYASRLDNLIENYQPSLWVHGHIHTSRNYRIGNTRIVSNPRGYVDDPNLSFDPRLTVDV